MTSISHILHTLSYMGLPLLFAVVLHEYAHGWVARYGDPMPEHGIDRRGTGIPR